MARVATLPGPRFFVDATMRNAATALYAVCKRRDTSAECGCGPMIPRDSWSISGRHAKCRRFDKFPQSWVAAKYDSTPWASCGRSLRHSSAVMIPSRPKKDIEPGDAGKRIRSRRELGRHHVQVGNRATDPAAFARAAGSIFPGSTDWSGRRKSCARHAPCARGARHSAAQTPTAPSCSPLRTLCRVDLRRGKRA